MRAAALAVAAFVVVAQPSVAQQAQQQVAKLKVQSVKPGLTERHVLTVRGFTQQLPKGGYTWTMEAAVRAPEGQTRGLIRIKMVGTADASAALAKGVPNDFVVTQKVELKDWKDKHGDFDVEVVDGDGATLFNGTTKI